VLIIPKIHPNGLVRYFDFRLPKSKKQG